MPLNNSHAAIRTGNKVVDDLGHQVLPQLSEHIAASTIFRRLNTTTDYTIGTCIMTVLFQLKCIPDRIQRRFQAGIDIHWLRYASILDSLDSILIYRLCFPHVFCKQGI